MPHFNAELDAGRLPLLLLKWQGTPDDRGSLDVFLADLLDVWHKAEALGWPVSIVVDAADASPLSAPLRQHQADWIGQHRQLFRKVVLSVHVSISNPLVRGALTAIRWLSTDLEVIHAHPRVDAALAAALADLAGAGQHVPSSSHSLPPKTPEQGT